MRFPHPFRVLVTRPRHQASALAGLLQAAGASAILIPTIAIVPPLSYEPLDAALGRLVTFDWLIFTSANAVEVFAERARLTSQPLKPPRIAVVGPATAKAVLDLLGSKVDRMPGRFVAEALAEALLPDAPGASMLLVRAAAARDLLPETLAAAGARLTLADAYRTIVPPTSISEIQELFARHPPDAITFTSASTAQNLHTLLETAKVTIPPRTILASIGPVTSDAMRALALEPTVEAPEATISSLLQTLLEGCGSNL